MGLFDWLCGGADNERDAPRHHPPPIPSKAGVGLTKIPDEGKDADEKDLRPVEGRYPDTDSFEAESKR